MGVGWLACYAAYALVRGRRNRRAVAAIVTTVAVAMLLAAAATYLFTYELLG